MTEVIDVIGDGWTFMILRECYFGVRRFEQLKELLALPRTTLSDRLRKLTASGILKRTPYSRQPLRHEYQLTSGGLALYPVLLALMGYGDKWLASGEEKPLQLLHKVCGRPCSAIVVCSECRQEIDARDVVYRDGRNHVAGHSGAQVGERGVRRVRRSADPTALERRRPSSVARALQVVGDRWTFMIVHEAFLGARRFDDLQGRLGIAPSILINRLSRLVADGVFRRVRYRTGPERFEYRFTEKGRDLFGSMAAMINWGSRWLEDAQATLVIEHAPCGHLFEPTIACDQCRGAIWAQAMGYVMNYRDPIAGD